MKLSAKAMRLLVLGLALSTTAASARPEAFQTMKDLRERGVVIQQYETSCAAAALATVLTYGFRKPVTERTLANQMLAHTDPQLVRAQRGFSLLDLRNAAALQGFAGSAYRQLTLDDLQYFRAPIVPIRTHGYKHYVVVNRVSADRVYLADPAFGNRSVARSRFVREWMNGMAFVVAERPAATEDAVPQKR